jgi:proline iminopeptidase
MIRSIQGSKMKRIGLGLVLQLSVLAPAFAQTKTAELYPPIEPLRSGYLRVADKHELYWEVCGNPSGIPVIVFDGGPGGSADPGMRRFFDPLRFHVLLFDQRGAGRSRTAGEWRDNTTQLLIEDVNKLRQHVRMGGRAMLFGGSWGTTLALAYTEAYPERVGGMVLRGVFLGTRAEIDHFYHGGAAQLFPDNWERLRSILPRPERLDYPRQPFEMATGADPEARRKAIEGWAYYEIRMAAVGMTDEQAKAMVDQHKDGLMSFSVLENYHMMNACFLKDGQLLRDVKRIAHIPTFIVHGRFDAVCLPRSAYELSKALARVKLEFPPATGHLQGEPANTEALLRGVEWVAEQMKGEQVAPAR